MFLLFKFLTKILTILNSEISPRQIAAGFAFGVMIGLVPIKGLLPPLLIFLGLLVNINLAAMFLAIAIFKLLSYAVDPIANVIGHFILVNVGAFKPLWTRLYNIPLVPYTRFNNTIVIGSFLLGLLLLIPIYFLAKASIVQYRTRLRDRILKFKVIQLLKASSLYRYYEHLRDLKGSP